MASGRAALALVFSLNVAEGGQPFLRRLNASTPPTQGCTLTTCWSESTSRCFGEPAQGWDNYGKGISVTQCEEACRNDESGCNYVVYNHKYDGCTKFNTCDLKKTAGHFNFTVFARASAGHDQCLQATSTCTVPTKVGYNTTGAGGNLTITGFDPTGVVCATGYTGTVNYTVCESSGTAYSVSGCETSTPPAPCPATCLGGSGFIRVAMCNACECAGCTATLFTNNCQSDVPPPCEASTPPTPCPATCLGRSGFIRVKMCNACECAGCTADLFTTNCQSKVPPPCEATCTVPTTNGYNTTGAGGNLTITGFGPTGVVCATGYTGTVKYTKCDSPGTAYSVSGCEASTPPTPCPAKCLGGSGFIREKMCNACECAGCTANLFTKNCQSYAQSPCEASTPPAPCPTTCLGRSGFIRVKKCNACECAGCTADLFTPNCQSDVPSPCRLV